MDYEKETRNAYDSKKAEQYKKQQISGMTWIRFATWREKIIVNKMLRFCKIREKSKVLDIPCGTGILGGVLGQFSCSVIASDISTDMMDLAHCDYDNKFFRGFVKADIISTPFKDALFDCVINLGLMHRLPPNIVSKALNEIKRVSGMFLIVSYAYESLGQRIKRWLLRRILSSYKPAPSLILLQDIFKEIEASGLSLVKSYKIMPFFSSKIILLLQKKHERV